MNIDNIPSGPTGIFSDPIAAANLANTKAEVSDKVAEQTKNVLLIACDDQQANVQLQLSSVSFLVVSEKLAQAAIAGDWEQFNTSTPLGVWTYLPRLQVVQYSGMFSIMLEQETVQKLAMNALQ